MTAEEAMTFVRERGVVLASGKGPVPRLAEAIAGGPIKGSWWAHPKSHEIFAVFQKLSASPDILVCRLVGGKVTFVHRRLWPALVRLADHFNRDQLAQVREEHTRSGHHVSHDVAFPGWVPREVLDEGQLISDRDAREALGDAVVSVGKLARRSVAKRTRPNVQRRR